jgi:FAD:protein FMN transferase
MTRRTFRAMGTEIELLAEADEDAVARALDAAEAEFHRLEALLSRFRAESELSRLNEAGALDAGPDLRRVVELALAARARSGGRFDITVHDAVVAAGYDRSFDDLAERDDEAVAAETADGGAARLRRRTPAADDVVVDGSRLSLRGVRIDLGGIGKGYAAERAAEILGVAAPCLVNAGGDIATRGGSWTVGIETAAEPLTLELAGGWALATSGRDRRRWTRGGRELHHLIDPRTGEPADSDLVRVTVVAADAVDAEVAAKSLFLAGADAAAAEADAAGIPAVLVTADHRTLLAGGLA